MKNLNDLNKFRDVKTAVALYGFAGDHETGIFRIPSIADGELIAVIATVGDGWDHVSASRQDRCPSWEEMEQIKRMFFRSEEVAFQLHVPAADHINVHPNCLHIWRPLNAEIPLPPSWMVGPKKAEGRL